MRLTTPGLDLEIRPCTPADLPLLLEFIRAMAAFEKLEVSATEASVREALFGPEPAARALLVFDGDRPAAYITYFFSFSTMLGRRGLWLEDIFVDPAYRGRGVGRALMAHLAGIARDHGCGRFEWTVLDWNEAAIRFYRGLGARVLPEWRICRVEGAGIAELAGADS